MFERTLLSNSAFKMLDLNKINHYSFRYHLCEQFSYFLIANSRNYFALGHLKEELSKTAKDAADTLSESGSKIGKTSAFRTISETAQAVQKEIDTSSFGGRVYRAPTQLRRRVEVSLNKTKVTPNEEATGMELHKDSR